MKRLFITIFILSTMLTGYSQKRIQFSYKDGNGCEFVFKTETAGGQEVALLLASNKKNAKLEIPEQVSYKGENYVVTRIGNESLKGCDDEIRELVFPNTVETIGGMLFGSVIKLSGGIGGMLKGGKGGPLSKIRLTRIVIPHSVYAIGENAFQTGFVKDEKVGLRGNIEDLPEIIMPWSAKDYGIEKEDVVAYWQKKDPNKLSPILAADAKLKKLVDMYEKSNPYNRNEMLKNFFSKDEIKQEAAEMLLSAVSDYDISKEEYIAAYQGYYCDKEKVAIMDEMYQEFEESVMKGRINLLPFVVQVTDPDSKEQQLLVQKFEQSESKGNYKSALSVVKKLLDYTSDPRLYFVKAVCLYKNNKFKDCLDDCLIALGDGRLSEDETYSVGMIASMAGEKYVEKVMQKVEKWERLLGAAEKAADEAIVSSINNMGQSNNIKQGYNTSMQQPVYSGSSDYYTSPAYLVQVQARADQFMVNAQQQFQQIGEYSLKNFQRQMERGSKMYKDMADWSLRFLDQNGREPMEIEKYQWIQQNYPDMYASYLDAQAAIYERSIGINKSEKEATPMEEPISNTYDCSYCGGSGRILIENETLSFGLASEKEYRCTECNKWKYKGKTHQHIDCTHCKNGKVTFN